MSKHFFRKMSKKMPARKSPSIPKNVRDKQTAIRKDNITKKKRNSTTSYETVNEPSSSLELDFLDDSSEDSDSGQEYSSIEVARAANTTYSAFDLNPSIDVLVTNTSKVLNDFSSDPREFNKQNEPIAASTPIRKTAFAFPSSLIIGNPASFNRSLCKRISSTAVNGPDSFVSRCRFKDHLTPCDRPSSSTSKKDPSVYYKNDDLFSISSLSGSDFTEEAQEDVEHQNFKSFMEFAEGDNTVREAAQIPHIEPHTETQEAVDHGVEDINESLLFVNTPISEIPELPECDRISLILNDNNSSGEVENNDDTVIETPDIGLVSAGQKTNKKKTDLIGDSDSKRKKKHAKKDKGLEGIPICPLSILPKHLINRRFPVIRKDKKRVKQNKELDGIPICPLSIPPKPLINRRVPITKRDKKNNQRSKKKANQSDGRF